jgi:hypothetical protein
LCRGVVWFGWCSGISGIIVDIVLWFNVVDWFWCEVLFKEIFHMHSYKISTWERKINPQLTSVDP